MRPIRDGSIWPPSWICTAAGSWAGRWPIICAPTCRGGIEDGHLGATARPRLDPPFRSGRSICLGGVSQGDAVSRLQGLDEPQGRLLRQCPDGELLPHAQNRARSSPAICNTNRSHDIFAYLTSTIERVVTPPSAISARSRWS